jgi:hypothetical protein
MLTISLIVLLLLINSNTNSVNKPYIQTVLFAVLITTLFIYNKPYAIVCFLLIVTFYFYDTHYENYENIVSELTYDAGFYSQFFYLINHYIYCKKNNVNFKIKSDNWLFLSKNGWTDYFEPITLDYGKPNETIVNNRQSLGDYPIIEYKNSIPEVYIYNSRTKAAIKEYMNKFNLVNYDSIFIRRGDKLANESKYYDESAYIDLLLLKNPKCDTLFIQTDDYNSYININTIIKDRNLNIKTYTLCKEDQVGVVVLNFQKNEINKSEKNQEYLSKIKDKLVNSKSVEDMNSEERYEHTITMIIGVDICMHSNICICDYQSNVSRFIKLAHVNPNNVYNILSPDIDVDYNYMINPAHAFSE